MTATKLGIWMDHEHALLTEFTTDPMTTTTISSGFDHTIKGESLTHGENSMHRKQQHLQKEYYKKLADHIRRYREVFVFGPTSAKSELINALREDHLFDDIKIRVEPADKMNETQIQALVRKYFSTR